MGRFASHLSSRFTKVAAITAAGKFFAHSTEKISKAAAESGLESLGLLWMTNARQQQLHWHGALLPVSLTDTVITWRAKLTTTLPLPPPFLGHCLYSTSQPHLSAQPLTQSLQKLTQNTPKQCPNPLNVQPLRNQIQRGSRSAPPEAAPHPLSPHPVAPLTLTLALPSQPLLQILVLKAAATPPAKAPSA